MNRSQVPADCQGGTEALSPAAGHDWAMAHRMREVGSGPLSSSASGDLVRDPEAREPSKPVSGHLVHQDSETINTYCFFPLSFIEENMTNKQLYVFKAYNVMFSYTCIL